MAEKKTLVRFNVQNNKYAVKGADGSYGAPVAYGTAKKISLEADASVKDIYGDGRRICGIVREKKKTGTLTTNNVSDDYEIAMGRRVRTANGLAEIRQEREIEYAHYFETCGLDSDGGMPVAKTWIFGVTSSRPAESFDQDTDDVNESSFDTPLTIAGTDMLDATGKKPYVDPITGRVVRVWQMTVVPGDPDYEIFGDAVVLPRMAQ